MGGLLLCLLSLLFFSACSQTDRQQVDKLNDLSYAYHYRNLDSADVYASRAYAMSEHYGSGRAEALNNMAFVSMARMDYPGTEKLLDEALKATDNQVEMLVSDVMLMRLCQRMSRNREFYDYCERARKRIVRIGEERDVLSERMRQRMIYAETEFAIVNSAYYYYVGLERQSAAALADIDPYGPVQSDTAQYLAYLYNAGSGGIITDGTPADISSREMELLTRCFFISSQHGYDFFVANSLGEMANHLALTADCDRLLATGGQAVRLIVPDSIGRARIAVDMATRSLDIFACYGDVYQMAAAHRTLATCFMAEGDYEAALEHLEMALADKRIAQAPDLVASIREQLSVAYSAVDDKPSSDYNRNIYIDLQEQTRQDRYLESHAAMLDRASAQLNVMIGVVLMAIIVLVLMLWLFYRLNRRRRDGGTLDSLLTPLREWQEADRRQADVLREKMDDINDAYALSMSRIRQGERRSMENRAKVSLVNSVIPFIDRIINEVTMLLSRDEDAGVRAGRYMYISELTGKINEYNGVLTHWIQMRQGRIDLNIGSFPLQPLFDIVAKGKAGFRMNGVTLEVDSTEVIVKADRVLTLFMINTLADNARKFTPAGGTVTISACRTDDYVEVSVKDTGCGMSEEQLAGIFDCKAYNGHGFGLMNCRGIIDRYRKISRIFSVCKLGAESREGHGSRFFFRLPCGVARVVVVLLLGVYGLAAPCRAAFDGNMKENNIAKTDSLSLAEGNLYRAKVFADSAYFSNIAGTYSRTVDFADSCRKYLNLHYLEHRPGGRFLMTDIDSTSAMPAEIRWFQDSVPTNYSIILDIRNESAVAALALHNWRLYTYNNKVYTQLFREMSADATLPEYCRMMQQSKKDKTVAVIFLVLILVLIPPAYYLLYYRHRLYFRFCVERIRTINSILLGDSTPEDKLRMIEPLTHEQYPVELQTVVGSIIEALEQAAGAHRRQAADIEMAEDERRRAEYEEGNLHVVNSVSDNCLSALKHETMYYPSRIAQMVDVSNVELKSLEELVAYYRDIYSMLSSQAMKQTERVKMHIRAIPVEEFTGAGTAIGDDVTTGLYVAGDRNLLEYLFEIIRRAAGQRLTGITAEPLSDSYLLITVPLPALQMKPDKVAALFVPAVDTIPFLLCRQIVRDHSEATNRYGCGIRAEISDGITVIKIVLPRWRQ